MTAPLHALLKPLALGVLALALALLALTWNGAPPAVRAAGPTCTVCLGGGCDYADIQAAVDDLGCMEIKVAQGVYSSVQGRPVPGGYRNPPASGLITQVVYINRTVTVRGGYTTTNWTTPDPWTQPATLNAGGLGRVLVIAGGINPVIEGLGLTGGNSAGLGGNYSTDCGGGVFIFSAGATLSACRVFGNTAGHGGGLYLDHSAATLSANSVTSNTTTLNGAGLYLDTSAATLSANRIVSNTSANYGGGLYVHYSSAVTLTANTVASNTAARYGGGLYMDHSTGTLDANDVTYNTAPGGAGLSLSYSPATLISNSVTHNQAGIGGGVQLTNSSATLISNTVASNSAGWSGGMDIVNYSDAALVANRVISNIARYGAGLLMYRSSPALTNTVIADNHASVNGGGVFIYGGSAPRLLHTTVARNSGGDGSGLYVESVAAPSTLWATNTILVSQTVGVTVTAGSTATLNRTLWYGNAADWGGAGTISHTEDYVGNPAFVDADAGDYHIGPGSAAVDRGVDVGVTTDKDGYPRDAQPDLGAYEAKGPAGPTCTVCLDGSCDYTVIQRAVDNAACTEIKVAQGVYTGVWGRLAPAGYDSPPASGLITQVVYISRTVTVRGGYTTTNWTAPHPLTQPTTLDAGGLGRVLVVAGDISPTIEGLGLTGGNSAGLGSYTEADSGGGAYVISATATLSACRVFGNIAGYLGGGLFLTYSPATLSANSVVSNSARYGGGLNLDHSAATLSANSVTSNTAANYGGGVYLFNSAATLSANRVASNTAQLEGGGLYLYYSPAVTLSANSVAANTAGNDGGGLLLYNSDAALSANSVTSNTAGRSGGGLYLWSSAAALTNTVVADNQAGATGGGLYLNNAAPRLLHTTIARNGGGDGSGLSVSSAASTVRLTNTILTSQTLGVSVTFGAVVMSNTLWYGNGSDYEVGAGTISHSGDFAGDPAFADAAGGDYHIGPGSAAIDRGVDAGVTTDKDGYPRDARPDLGAYEFQGTATDSYLYLPIIVKGAR